MPEDEAAPSSRRARSPALPAQTETAATVAMSLASSSKLPGFALAPLAMTSRPPKSQGLGRHDAQPLCSQSEVGTGNSSTEPSAATAPLSMDMQAQTLLAGSPALFGQMAIGAHTSASVWTNAVGSGVVSSAVADSRSAALAQLSFFDAGSSFPPPRAAAPPTPASPFPAGPFFGAPALQSTQAAQSPAVHTHSTAPATATPSAAVAVSSAFGLASPGLAFARLPSAFSHHINLGLGDTPMASEPPFSPSAATAPSSVDTQAETMITGSPASLGQSSFGPHIPSSFNNGPASSGVFTSSCPFIRLHTILRLR